METDASRNMDPLVAAARDHGLPPEEVEAIASRVAGRTCGECTACCTVKGVPELGKPTQTDCRHLCQSGCAIYERRPKSCRDYACLWRQGWIDIDERHRPDKLGVVIDHEPFAKIPGSVLLVVWEVVAGAMESDLVQRVVNDLVDQHSQIRAVAYCAAGQPAGHNYLIDRQSYPGDDVPLPEPIVSFDAARRLMRYEFRKAG